MSGIDYFTCGIIILASSFVHGLSGFGFAILAIPLLTLVIDIKSAITLSVTCSLFISLYNIVSLKQFFSLASLKELLIGSFIGIPLGASLLRRSHAELVEFLLGMLIVAFVLLSISKLVKLHGLSDRWGYLFGLVSGISGGAVSISGPPVLIYSYMRGWGKEEFKGVFAAYIFITGIFIQVSHITTGLATYTTFKLFLGLSPFLFIGGFAGHYYFKSIDTVLFKKIVLFILTILGTMMIVTNV